MPYNKADEKRTVTDPMLQEDEEDIQKMMHELKTEHRDLDIILQQLSNATPIDFLRLQRLKKRKLFLKDSISKLESMLLPDIIA